MELSNLGRILHMYALSDSRHLHVRSLSLFGLPGSGCELSGVDWIGLTIEYSILSRD